MSTYEHKKKAYENLADNLIEKFNLRGIEGYYVDNAEEACAMAQRFLTPGCSVAWGGSQTIVDIGLLDVLRNSDYEVFDRSLVQNQEEQEELNSKVVNADYYFMSSNAITMDGQLVNIDGIGNRVANLIYGPKNVIIVAGMNKVTGNVDEAIDRAHNFAAPPNSIRLGQNTPCAKYGHCADCVTEDCICCQVVVTRKSRVPNRIKVILVGEELGF